MRLCCALAKGCLLSTMADPFPPNNTMITEHSRNEAPTSAFHNLMKTARMEKNDYTTIDFQVEYFILTAEPPYEPIYDDME